MATFNPAEVEEAYRNFVAVGDSGDWNAWADLHTIDGSKLEFEYTPIGEGDVDYPTILQNLRDHNCDVVVSVATHFVPASGSRLEAMHTNFANLRRLIAETS